MWIKSVNENMSLRRAVSVHWVPKGHEIRFDLLVGRNTKNTSVSVPRSQK